MRIGDINLLKRYFVICNVSEILSEPWTTFNLDNRYFKKDDYSEVLLILKLYFYFYHKKFSVSNTCWFVRFRKKKLNIVFLIVSFISKYLLKLRIHSDRILTLKIWKQESFIFFTLVLFRRVNCHFKFYY